MIPLLAILAASILPHDRAIRDSANIAEVQHYYDEHGRLVFDQLVFWCADDHVIWWKLIKTESDLPRRDWQYGGYVTTFMDGEQLRSVRAPSFRERWEQWDVELADREAFPKEKRRGLKPSR